MFFTPTRIRESQYRECIVRDQRLWTAGFNTQPTASARTLQYFCIHLTANDVTPPLGELDLATFTTVWSLVRNRDDLGHTQHSDLVRSLMRQMKRFAAARLSRPTPKPLVNPIAVRSLSERACGKANQIRHSLRKCSPISAAFFRVLQCSPCLLGFFL